MLWTDRATYVLSEYDSMQVWCVPTVALCGDSSGLLWDDSCRAVG